MDSPLRDLPLVTAGREISEARAVTILVHGRGRTPEEMIALSARLALPNMAFVAPTAANGTWYPEPFRAPLEKNEPHLGWALDRLDEIVLALEARGLTRDRIALVGFSQGACLVAEYIYRRKGRWGALAVLTGAVIGPEETARDATGNLHGTPIFMGSSDIDAWVPLERVEATAALFTAMGASVDLRITPGMDHVVSDEQLAATSALLAPLV